MSDVARVEDFAEVARLQAVGGQALLRIMQINRLWQNTLSFYTRCLGDAEQSAANEIRIVVKLRVGVFRAGDRRQFGASFGNVANDNGRRYVGVKLRRLEAGGDVAGKERRHVRVIVLGAAIHTGKAAAGDDS